MHTKQYFVYIATNKINTVLYTGVTNNLIKRIDQYKKGMGSLFTSKYKVNKLVYYEITPDVSVAIAREKQLKAGTRKKKMELIERMNPKWNDLYEALIK